jgi:hypothetical protein
LTELPLKTLLNWRKSLFAALAFGFQECDVPVFVVAAKSFVLSRWSNFMYSRIALAEGATSLQRRIQPRRKMGFPGFRLSFYADGNYCFV